MTVSGCESVFHEGEQIVQHRMGVREAAENLGRHFVRDYLTVEHQEFYQKLPFIFVGSVDESGRPWASILYGRPGFLSTPVDTTLRVQAHPFLGDPLEQALVEGASLGFLGIEFDTRRRNRLAGRVAAVRNDYFEVQIDQSYGNCPQFIQARQFEFLPRVNSPDYEAPVHQLVDIDDRAKGIISKADNFYIATYFGSARHARCHGVDVSHRGGRPGFVEVVDDRHLKFPDFSGNNLFNTLGNIELNPLAGLLFIDFDSGDLLYLTGDVEIDWDSAEVAGFKGAQSIVKFSITAGFVVARGLPMKWSFKSYSPMLEQTGAWKFPDESDAEVPAAHEYQEYRVFRIENESENIRSFYLRSGNGTVLPVHRAGQYLPIEIRLPGEAHPVSRTYTISNAPNGEYFRLSVKREPPRAKGMPPGVASNYLHDNVAEGSVILAARPQGNFVLEENSTRPVVLLSGGVGITPVLSMLQQLLRDLDEGNTEREIWFIHAAQNSALQGFRNYLQSIVQRYPSVSLYTVYSNPLPTDQRGMHYDAVGFVDVDLLTKILPPDDYEYYYCGPPPFMKSLKQGLDSLGVPEKRVHFEYFGSPPALAQVHELANEASSQQSVQIYFRKSGIEAEWNSTRGTLLEFAESEGLRPAYSCRSGICQTCATPVVAGKTDYVQNLENEPAPGSVLICCAIPQLTSSVSQSEKLILDL